MISTVINVFWSIFNHTHRLYWVDINVEKYREIEEKICIEESEGEVRKRRKKQGGGQVRGCGRVEDKRQYLGRWYVPVLSTPSAATAALSTGSS